MWESILAELSSYDSYEWGMFVTGILYAAFSMLNKSICWVFGIISCGLLAYKDFTSYGLYFDGVLQIFYILLGISGIYHWVRSTTPSGEPRIGKLPFLSHVNAWILGLLLSFIMVGIVRMFYNPAFALFDSITTVFSLWATWLLVNRVYENWYYWIIINISYIYLYYMQGGALASVLYIVYFFTAIGGLIAWRKSRAIPDQVEVT